MKARPANSTGRRAGIGALAAAVSTLAAPGARAQGDPCEQLKSVLAARIPPEVRGYSMEAVPANAPVPPGAKAIGNCGANKILYRRWGGTTAPAAGAANTPSPAVAPKAAATAQVKEVKRPVSQAESPVSNLALAPAAVAPPPPMRPIEPAPVVAMPAPEPERAGVRRAADPAPEPRVAVAAPEPASPQADDSGAAKASLTQRTREYVMANWRWLALLALLPTAGWLWAWLAHRRVYDAAGLPRGPRL